MRTCVHACVRACVRAYVHACVRACVCVDILISRCLQHCPPSLSLPHSLASSLPSLPSMFKYALVQGHQHILEHISPSLTLIFLSLSSLLSVLVYSP